LQVSHAVLASRTTLPSVAVAITLSHRTAYTDDEEVAFRHVRHYLARYDKYVVVPRSHGVRYPGLTPMRFDDRYFGSSRAHAALLLSDDFYRAFSDYEFLLVYHLDALVFSDQLAEWCDAGYDFIGPPWLVCADTPHITEAKVGNGGFSLRRVSSFRRVLRSRRYFVEPEEYWRRYAARTAPLLRAINSPRRLLKRLLMFNDIHWHIRWAIRGDVHEDRFWAENATQYDPGFRIAPVETALRFAIEATPRACVARIGGLPFGAHRWARFDRAVYEPYLLREGIGSGLDWRDHPADSAGHALSGERAQQVSVSPGWSPESDR
jgi:hypothetical protein